MNKKSGTSKAAADKLVKNIRRKTRQTYSAEEKIRIVLAGLRGEESISALCRREGISESLYYSWSKEFLEAGTINEMWQTDFTYFKIIGSGQYYLSTILDDYSRYIIAWKLCSNMRAEDVTDTIELALAESGCNQAVVRHMPRLLSDNGSCYISGDLAEWLDDHKMGHVRGAPFHPQTQGKIERWHQTMKNRVLLENYYLPGDLERQIGAFVDYYNNERYHESLNNVTPADVYFGRDKTIIRERKKIKKLTTQKRRLQHQKQAA